MKLKATIYSNDRNQEKGYVDLISEIVAIQSHII